ncbi:hypothetical protein [Mucilaginibacter myungsuensis]|uniref:Uncharacterized protein n=1 Tax=Mucilaginibacter myungsuensis TaxID=649104 RepID=A0A929KUS1_9SPHI|nr:hypothetical protein [Mucilaginibacter myungsuensis]MBE9661944.1 hypothetical protein [Mucilaginibacter myungsuensis]MDN3599623.1 hypothetical protein [Mucilaginibacter myungsuensis]
MLKRWAHILISAWLINALICFHPNNFLECDNDGAITSFDERFPYNTAVDIFFNYVNADNDQPEDGTQHRIAHSKRYIGARSFVLNIVPPFVQEFKPVEHIEAIARKHFRAWDNKIFLPPLHHFLFRLSPF